MFTLAEDTKLQKSQLKNGDAVLSTVADPFTHKFKYL